MDSDRKDVTAILERLASTRCPHCDSEIDVSELDPFAHAECPHCAKTLVVPAALGPFLLTDVIGKGGMGGVYRAIDQTLGRPVAIKVMLSSLGSNREFVETFKREAQSAAKLNHPHIAQIYSFGEEKGQPYIVMELVDGRGLDKLIESGKRLDQGLIMQIGLDIAEGLNEADQIGLVHGDIKPENILLDEKMNGKLVDFGIASFADQGVSEGIWGTPYYIAPEKLRRQPADARSDIYSLGATLYHALAGRPPFEGETPIEVVKARLEQEPLRLRDVREDINEDIERIIARMLRMDPASRYPTYSSLISDMRKVVQFIKPDREKGLKSKKIKIRRKGAGGRPISTGAASSIGGIPAGGSEAAMAAAKKQKAEDEKQWRRAMIKKLVWTLAAILVLFGIAGGGLYMKIRHDRRIAARRAHFNLMAAKQNAESAHGSVKAAATNVLHRAALAEPIVANATNLVTVVTEGPAADLMEWLDRESPRFDPAAEAAANEAAAQEPAAAAQTATTNTPAAPAQTATTNTPAAPAQMATTNTPAAAAQTATTNTPAAPSDATHPVPPDAVATADVATADVAAADVTAAAEGGATQLPAVEPEAVAPAAETAEPDPAAREPEIRILARELLADALRVRVHAVAALRIGYEADGILSRAAAGRQASDVEAQAIVLKGMQDTLSRTRGEVDKALERMTLLIGKMDTIKIRTLRSREEREKARAEEERLRREEEEKQRQEQERRHVVEREMAEVDSAVEEIKPLLREQEYERAMRELTDRKRNVSTDEAKERMQVLVDRYDRMGKLKLFLVRQLTDAPFRWGWVQGISPEDILGANEVHVKLRNRTVPWKDVSVRQMVHFIRQYVTRANRGVTLAELANQALAAAIYCHENGGYDAARVYRQQAVEFHPRLQADADRLLPDSPPP